MKAIILAAGAATRLKPLTDNTPKCLLNVGGKSILERTIDNLVANGIMNFVIVTGFLNTMIEDFLSNNYSNLNFTFIFNEKYDSTNNIYSLWLAKSEILGHDIILMDSDIVFDSRIIGQLLSSDHENCLSVRSTNELGDEEMKLVLNDGGHIREISKDVNPASSVGESMGIQKFERDFVWRLFTIVDQKVLDRNEVNGFYESAFQDAIYNGAKIYPVDVDKYECMEIDTAEDLQEAEKLVEYLV